MPSKPYGDDYAVVLNARQAQKSGSVAFATTPISQGKSAQVMAALQNNEYKFVFSF
jgi:hypothetical protein